MGLHSELSAGLGWEMLEISVCLGRADPALCDSADNSSAGAHSSLLFPCHTQIFQQPCPEAGAAPTARFWSRKLQIRAVTGEQTPHLEQLQLRLCSISRRAAGERVPPPDFYSRFFLFQFSLPAFYSSFLFQLSISDFLFQIFIPVFYSSFLFQSSIPVFSLLPFSGTLSPILEPFPPSPPVSLTRLHSCPAHFKPLQIKYIPSLMLQLFPLPFLCQAQMHSPAHTSAAPLSLICASLLLASEKPSSGSVCVKDAIQNKPVLCHKSQPEHS